MKNKADIVTKLKELIDEGIVISKLEQPTQKNPSIKTIREGDKISKWINFSRQFIISIFGENSHFYREFEKQNEKNVYYSSQVNIIRGILEAMLEAVENDYLNKYSVNVSASISNNILSEAEELNKKGFILAAAIYVRIALESYLKKKAESLNINIKQIISRVNDEMKSQNIHNKEIHSKIQAWLHLGNYAAHNTDEFKEYNQEKINQYIIEVNNYIKNNEENNNGK